MTLGCGSRNASTPKKSAPPSDDSKVREVMTGPARLVRRSEKPSREQAYEVHWKSSDLTYDEGSKNYGGTMEVVSGTIFQKDLPAADFTADHGEADKKSSTLELHGHVRVVSKSDSSVMTCDNLVWLVDTKTIKATGNVVALIPDLDDAGHLRKKSTIQATVGPVDELWCTPDLQTVATPDLFPKK